MDTNTPHAPSSIERARRAQIIACTIDAAAELTTPDLAARTAALIDLFDRATRP